MTRRPQLNLIAPSASPVEAAAITAALEQFMRDHAPAPVAGAEPASAWLRTALLEGVSGHAEHAAPWGNAPLWGAGGNPRG